MTESPSPSDPIPFSRGSKGRFRKGGRGGPGRPPGSSGNVNALRAALLRAISPEDVELAIAKLRNKVIKGNLAALDLFLRYAVGGADRLHSAVEIAEREKAISDALNANGSDQSAMVG